MQDEYANAEVIIVGDFNARVAEIEEFMVDGEKHMYINGYQSMEIDVPKRRNKDKIIN